MPFTFESPAPFGERDIFYVKVHAGWLPGGGDHARTNTRDKRTINQR